MSPKTTPSAAMTSLREASLRGSATAADERACMGRALYCRSGFSPTSFDDGSQPARDSAAEAGAEHRRYDQVHGSGILRAEAGALDDQRVHHARIVQPRREAERHRDAGDCTRNDHEQRATPAASQRLQILLELLLHALSRGR